MVSRRRLLLLGLLGAGLLAAQHSPLPTALARTPEARNAKLDAELRRLVEGRTTPGVAVLILQDGRPAYSRAVGVRDPRGQAPLGMDDMFRLASMTKPVTSVATLILVEEGRIGLDDPVSRFLPEFADLRVRRPDGTPVPANRPPMIRELLTHTAGFSYNFLNRPGFVDAYREARVVDGLADPEVTTEEAMRRLAAAPLAFQPGTEWHYSLGTDVLGAVIEKVTGRPLGAFVTERIARPLGLDSWVFNAPSGAHERFVTVTQPRQGGGVDLVSSGERVPYPLTQGVAVMDPERAFSATAYHSGGAGMSGTIGDYARFAQMLLNKGELDGTRILGEKTVELMASNHLPPAIGSNAPGEGYGLGVSVVIDPAAAGNLASRGAFGWTGAATTRFIVDPEEELVAVFMTQRWPYDSRLLAEFETLVYQAIAD
jgi:CubicO group peptidase (beta-lactamase class C family)